MKKENREIKVTIRFTESEMDRITAMLHERNSGKSTAGDSMTAGIKALSLSEFFREKILILNRSLELKKIRLELSEINTRLGQIEMYLSRKGANADETFTSEILGDIQKRIRALMLRMEEKDGGYGSEEH